MCELLGICAAKEFRANDLLRAFYRHSDVHMDGWGLATFRGRGVSLEKEPVKASDSVYLRRRLSRGVSASNLMAHIRRATVGNIEYANCHPFVWDDESGRTWTMMHNGTIFEGDLLKPFVDQQEGTTDSERILMYIVSRMNAFLEEHGRAPEAEDRFRILNRIVLQLAPGNKLNLILFDGEYMYVHTNDPGTLYQWHGDGDAEVSPEDEGILQPGVPADKPEGYVFATKPVFFRNWEPVPMKQLQVFRAGQKVWEGTPHDYEYHDEDHDMTWILAAYAGL